MGVVVAGIVAAASVAGGVAVSAVAAVAAVAAPIDQIPTSLNTCAHHSHRYDPIYAYFPNEIEVYPFCIVVPEQRGEMSESDSWV